MKSYKALNNQIYSSGKFSLVPIRFEDKLDIMKWRNEQLYHLRQQKPLTLEDQEKYFNDVISNLFEQEKPNQILFSFLENDICVGYGGLVHINWINKNAEISFLMDTDLEKKYFNKYWKIYLALIEKLAFKNIGLKKIYTYSYNIRPQLFDVLLNSEYVEEAVLKDHVFVDNSYQDIRIHSKFNN